MGDGLWVLFLRNVHNAFFNDVELGSFGLRMFGEFLGQRQKEEIRNHGSIKSGEQGKRHSSSNLSRILHVVEDADESYDRTHETEGRCKLCKGI